MIPTEHQIQCSTCERFFDARDLGQVMSHGVMNPETGEYECRAVEAPYSSSRNIGDSVEWTKDKRPIHNN